MYELRVCAGQRDVAVASSQAWRGREALDEKASRGRAPDRRTHPKSQSAKTAIGLTASVMETAKTPVARGPAPEAQSGRGLARRDPRCEPLVSVTCTILFSHSIWRSQSRVKSMRCACVAAPVLLGTASDGSLLIKSPESRERGEFLRRTVKTLQHNGQ